MDCLVHEIIVGQFGFELLATSGCEAIETDFAIRFGDTPLGGYPALEKNSLKRWVKRPFLDMQHFGREGVNPLGDRVTVQRARAKHSKDE
jgi:hypothetical protein